MKRKKRVVIGLCSLLVLLIIGIGVRYFYPVKVRPEDKVVLSDELLPLSSAKPPSMELYAKSITIGIDEYVIEGKILSEQEMNPMFLVKGSQEEFNKKYGQVYGTNMIYTVRVDEVWYGNISEEEILVKIAGDKNSMITKPKVGDNVILFLSLHDGDDYYSPVYMEHSIFTNNGSLYAFSNVEEFCDYDGKKADVLKKDFYNLLDQYGIAYEPR